MLRLTFYKRTLPTQRRPIPGPLGRVRYLARAVGCSVPKAHPLVLSMCAVTSGLELPRLPGAGGEPNSRTHIPVSFL